MSFLRSSVPGFAQAYIVDYAAAARHSRDAADHRRLSAQRRGRAALASCRGNAIGVYQWSPWSSTLPAMSNGRGRPIPQSRGFNHLPYRTMLPQRPGNLLVASRCASMTREGHSAARVSGGCFVMGRRRAPPRIWHWRETRLLRRSMLPSYRACWKLGAPISGVTSPDHRRSHCDEDPAAVTAGGDARRHRAWRGASVALEAGADCRSVRARCDARHRGAASCARAPARRNSTRRFVIENKPGAKRQPSAPSGRARGAGWRNDRREHRRAACAQYAVVLEALYDPFSELSPDQPASSTSRACSRVNADVPSPQHGRADRPIERQSQISSPDRSATARCRISPWRRFAMVSGADDRAHSIPRLAAGDDRTHSRRRADRLPAGDRRACRRCRPAASVALLSPRSGALGAAARSADAQGRPASMSANAVDRA